MTISRNHWMLGGLALVIGGSIAAVIAFNVGDDVPVGSSMSPDERLAAIEQQHERETLVALNSFAHHRDIYKPMDATERDYWLVRYKLCEAAKRAYDDARAEMECEALRR